MSVAPPEGSRAFTTTPAHLFKSIAAPGNRPLGPPLLTRGAIHTQSTSIDQNNGHGVGNNHVIRARQDPKHMHHGAAQIDTDIPRSHKEHFYTHTRAIPNMPSQRNRSHTHTEKSEICSAVEHAGNPEYDSKRPPVEHHTLYHTKLEPSPTHKTKAMFAVTFLVPFCYYAATFNQENSQKSLPSGIMLLLSTCGTYYPLYGWIRTITPESIRKLAQVSWFTAHAAGISACVHTIPLFITQGLASVAVLSCTVFILASGFSQTKAGTRVTSVLSALVTPLCLFLCISYEDSTWEHHIAVLCMVFFLGIGALLL